MTLRPPTTTGSTFYDQDMNRHDESRVVFYVFILFV